MRHVSCVLLLEWSTTSQRLWVYRISVQILIARLTLSPYSTGNWVCVGYKMQMKSTPTKLNVHCQCENFALGTQHNLYSTDSRWGFALGDANFKIGMGVTQIFSVFRYQPVGIGNTKLWRWGSVPNANGFASQWNPLRRKTICVGY